MNNNNFEINIINIRDQVLAKKINLLQKESYQVEANITGIKNIPNIFEKDEDLINSNEDFIALFKEGEVLGSLSYQSELDGTVRICRLVVSPKSFGSGVGSSLIQYFLDKTSGNVIVTTGKGNEPAKRLYEKKGFKYTGEIKNNSNISMWEFKLERD